MTESAEASARRQALDPSRSFIVEAPAGSGKTELLIQRYLRLMARVDRPEQVVAITFTRKAAAEMRQRVIETLRAATEVDPALPPHRQPSLELARDLLAHAERSEWRLIDQPGRLRITTIDALSTSLAQRMPVPTEGIGGLPVTDNPGRLYTQAARRATESLADPTPIGAALRRLLRAADNSLPKLDRWLAGALPQRDGWLRELPRSPGETLIDKVAANLARVSRMRLEAMRRLVRTEDEARLFGLLSVQADDRSGGGPPSADADWQDADSPENEGDRLLEAWRHAANVLLKRDGQWRKRFTSAEGFPPQATARRRELGDLLGVLHRTDGLQHRLAELLAVPDRLPSKAQSELLPAVAVVLPRLLAELRVLFEEHGVVDHTEIALAAERALGSVDQPSELLLALDRRIAHILVDEFQDTSHLQWRLLEKLTSGWEAGDGRTLFLVGDPMQSIYRFRDADLTLFFEAGRRGLGGLQLDSIALRENHRSAAEIVDWVNSTFAVAFPAGAATGDGVPAYRPASATHAAGAAAGVALHVFGGDDREAETDCVIDVVRRELAEDTGRSVGILVRSRTHLQGLRAAFRNAGLDARAVEIDSLSETQLGLDLIGLTSALVHPGDRLSWLGVLRSPWCGLEWSDVLALCGDDRRTVWESIGDSARMSRLSAAGRARLEWLRNRLQQGFDLRASRTFSRWIRDCWLLIDGPATLATRHEIDIAERFFAALQRLSRFGDVDDPATLTRHFAEPADGGASPARAGVEIMTMHRAKGLEFDTVILPALGRLARANEDKLLYCEELHTSDYSRVSLLAAASESGDPVCDFLRVIERQRDAEERGRLLYVAATRARTRLHLIGSVDRVRGLPRTGSLLATLWPCLEAPPDVVRLAEPAKEQAVALVARPLRRLSFDGDVPEPPLEREQAGRIGADRPAFEWVNPASVQVGTLIHRELQRLAEVSARSRTDVPPRLDIGRYRSSLRLLGVEDRDLDAAAARVAEALENVWADPVGRWILKPWPEAWSELRLTIRGQDRLDHVQLDRSFVDDNGVRWIIDYKTGRHLGSDSAGFLDSEVERYRGQLNRYAVAVARTDVRPIRVGLYFPLVTAFRDWDPTLRAGPG